MAQKIKLQEFGVSRKQPIKRITVKQIMSWGPCRDWPESRVVEVFGGKRSMTLRDVIMHKAISDNNKLWALLRPEVLGDRVCRELVCDYTDRALRRERKAGREPDKRSWDAVKVSRRFARGEASAEELAAAAKAAWAAAARADADWAAESAAWAARADADWAAESAAWAAEFPAWAAEFPAWAAERARQVELILKYLED